ncbi:ATP-binding cassette domain-containing protein [Mesorhizobium sp. M7A.F.Ca.US.002.01.1.1]|uniref:ATP-binding cassette domain-containing protein n=1 Tax=Mesorhizobium sp. M7A.F.Ca.US.002.01.1.1 TaxID=2496700 RepID=UPI000FD20E4C|nr:ATP-binding cassette domain-containing protein [Mesorhizobium sp. M7A.F.Ca.US.002.01.1.1]RVA08841.1 ATP-binding cassette domain-containing protein [Mesorhizobium sp. M7A.F.Ca.US.002.01.1.1]
MIDSASPIVPETKTGSPEELAQTKAPWRLALVLAFAALAGGILLTGVSIWFLGAVALVGLTPAALTFNFHVPAAFIRLFALTRTAAKYGERVVGHRAALTDQVLRRSTLFTAMASAPSVRRAGWQLGNQDRLADYLDDVEDVDYARLRVSLPSATLGVAIVLLVAATLWMTPLAFVPILLLITANMVGARCLAKRATADLAAARESRQEASRLLGTAIQAVVPLQGERRWGLTLEAPFDGYANAQTRALVLRHGQALYDTLANCLAPCAMLSILVSAWLSGLRGEALLPTALLAFAWLAAAESVLGASKIVVAFAREKAARSALAQWNTPDGVTHKHVAERISSLTLDRLPRHAPDGRLIGRPISATLRAGRPTVLHGASGCGKTSLLKQVAGWLDARDECVLGDGIELSEDARRAMSCFCTHDATVLADTVRENLFAPHASEDELWRALDAVELQGRIRSAGGLDGWITQDVLSLGEAQRLNLARVWLSDRPVILLDEPTEHLAAEQGKRILDALLQRLRQRIVIFSSHDDLTPKGATAIRLRG